MTGKNAILTAASAALILALGVSPALAQVVAIQSQDINQPGFVADLIEAKRSDGVLSVKVRLKNTGAKAEKIQIYNYSTLKIGAFYVQAEGKKYFVLRDTEKAPLAAGNKEDSLSPTVAPGASFTCGRSTPRPPPVSRSSVSTGRLARRSTMCR